jgi:hypothetical protein
MIANLYQSCKRYDKSLKYAEKCLTLTNSNEALYSVRGNLAKLYNHLNNPIKSIRYSKANLSINSADYDAQFELAFSYFLLNDKVESEKILRELSNRDDLPEEALKRIRFNLGTYDLYAGKFQEGMKGFILGGQDIGIWKGANMPYQFWDGGIKPGRTIVVLAEGGIGDEIINVRFCKHLSDLGMNPVWYTKRESLVQLFNRNGFNSASDLSDIPEDALWTRAMALPIYLNLELDDLWYGAYLTPSEEYLEKWKWLNEIGKPLLGLRWSGNPEYEQDLHRGVPLDGLYNAVKDKGYGLVSLQRDDGADEVLKYPDILDLSDKLDTYEDTLAVMYYLDKVATSCTSVAHAAASGGCDTMIMVPITAYYVYASSLDESTAWYGSDVKILRQSEHRSWDSVLNRVSELV